MLSTRSTETSNSIKSYGFFVLCQRTFVMLYSSSPPCSKTFSIKSLSSYITAEVPFLHLRYGSLPHYYHNFKFPSLPSLCSFVDILTFTLHCCHLLVIQHNMFEPNGHHQVCKMSDWRNLLLCYYAVLLFILRLLQSNILYTWWWAVRSKHVVLYNEKRWRCWSVNVNI
jgi:hypothetical protein